MDGYSKKEYIHFKEEDSDDEEDEEVWKPKVSYTKLKEEEFDED
jgi:hypothetical protein